VDSHQSIADRFDHRVCSVPIIFLIDFRGLYALAASVISLNLIVVGSRLFESDTSENWLEISYGGMIRNGVGAVFLLL